MTICRIERNNAEARLKSMRARGWQPETGGLVTAEPTEASDEAAAPDLEELALDQIAKLIEMRFKGHNLTRLVEGILQAQGYTTYRSPEGADGGVDVLAGSGPLGFGSPQLCVEVKSGSTPTDRPTVDKLLGAVAKFGAKEGLFISWAGFKNNVQKELAQSFFRLRLWNRNDLLKHLFANYERLDEDLRAELPLKRVWTVAAEDHG
jgi:restriction system protein